MHAWSCYSLTFFFFFHSFFMLFKPRAKFYWKSNPLHFELSQATNILCSSFKFNHVNMPVIRWGFKVNVWFIWLSIDQSNIPDVDISKKKLNFHWIFQLIEWLSHPKIKKHVVVSSKTCMVEVSSFFLATLKTQRTNQRKDQLREMSFFKARAILSGKVDSYLYGWVYKSKNE